GAVRAALASDGPLLASDALPIHPARIYGELMKVLDDDAVVIGDGGDFVSFAGKYLEPTRPGGWLDPGPFGCLGTGLGYAIAARPGPPSRPGLPRLRHRGPAGPAVRAGRPAARRRCGRLLADGRRHPGPARAAGRDGVRQQRRLGAGAAPHAGHLWLRRRRRPAATDPLRRGSGGPRRRG